MISLRVLAETIPVRTGFPKPWVNRDTALDGIETNWNSLWISYTCIQLIVSVHSVFIEFNL